MFDECGVEVHDRRIGCGCSMTAESMSALNADTLTGILARLRGSLPSSTFGVVAQDLSGAIISWTPAAEQILGTTGEHLLGRTSTDPVWSTITGDGEPMRGDDQPAMVALRTGRPVTGVSMGVRRGGGAVLDYAWMSVDSFPAELRGTGKVVVTCFSEVDAERAARLQLQHSERVLRLITSRLHEVVGLHALDGRWLWASFAAETVLGYRADELVDTDVFDLIAFDHRSSARSAFTSLIDGFGPVTVTIPLRHNSGNTVWVEVFGQLISDPAGRPYQVQSCFRDITDRVLAQTERDSAVVAMTSVLRTSPSAMILLGMDGRIQQTNTALNALIGLPGPDVRIGASLLDLVHPDHVDHVRRERAAIAAGRRASMKYEARWRVRGSDDTVWIESLSVPLRGADGVVTAILEHITDVTARRLADDALRRRAEVDTLTGLWNREAFLAAVRTAMQTNVDANACVELAFVDVDDFKIVNDTWGHHVGDEVLIEIAARLRTIVDDGWVTRYGGDEFALAYLISANAEPGSVDERIASIFDDPFVVGHGLRLNMSASVGVARGVESDPSDLVRSADRRMYLSKHEHRSNTRERTIDTAARHSL